MKMNSSLQHPPVSLLSSGTFYYKTAQCGGNHQLSLFVFLFFSLLLAFLIGMIFFLKTIL